MQYVKFLVCCLLAATSTLYAGSTATLAPSCTSDLGNVTLNDYINMSGACSIGILNFSSFSFSVVSFTTPTGSGHTAYDPTNIAVTPVSTGTDTGLAYSALTLDTNGNPVAIPFGVAAGDKAVYQIMYGYVIDPGPVDAGMDLGLDPPQGYVTFNRQLCADSYFAGDSCYQPPSNYCGQECDRRPPAQGGTYLPIQSLTVGTMPTDFPLTAHLDLDPQVANFAWVIDTITLDGTTGDGAASFDMVVTGSNIVSSDTPEPASCLLALGGLLAAAYRRRQTRG